MPYIRTDEQGNVVSIHRDPTSEATEQIAAGDPRVEAFLGHGEGASPGDFLALDLDLIRVFKRRAKRETLASGGILVDNFKLF